MMMRCHDLGGWSFAPERGLARQPLALRVIRMSPAGMKWLQKNRRGRTQSEVLRLAINHGLERAATGPLKLIRPGAGRV